MEHDVRLTIAATTLLALALLTGNILAAPPRQNLTWIRTGGPPGGLGYDIRYNFNDPNIWYVTDNFAGVSISYDNGLTWQPSNTGIPPQSGPTGDWIPIFSLTVDPLNPNIVWAGTDVTGHIYRSTDGGRTWEQRDNGVTIQYDGLTFRGFTVDPRSSDIVYAMAETIDESLGGPRTWNSGTGGQIYKTTDGGASWQLIWDGGMPSSLTRYMWIDPRDPNVLIVSTGIFDRGATSETATPDNPLGGLGILKSTDGGQTWRVIGYESGLRMLYIGSLAMHPKNPDILLAAAGHVFEPEILPFIEGLMEQNLPSPTGVYLSTDGGEHWEQVLSAFEVFSSVEYCTANPNIAYAGSREGFYRSEDAGQTWTRTTEGDSWGSPGVIAGFPIDIQCDPRDPNRLFVNNYGGGNFLSEDGGRTWSNASQGYTGAQIREVTLSPENANAVYAIGRSGVWYTPDGGNSWLGRTYPISTGDTTVAFMEGISVSADPMRPGHILIGMTGPVIAESSDGGMSWHSVIALREGMSPGTIAFAPSDSNIVYIGLSEEDCLVKHEPTCSEFLMGGVMASHDGGTTWELIWDARDRLNVLDVAVAPDNANTLYAATTSGLMVSHDGGVTWDTLHSGNGAIFRAVAVSPNDPNYIIAAIERYGAIVSRDGGVTWQQGIAGLEVNGSIHEIEFDPTNPQTVYATDYYSGAYVSYDGGITWQRINEGLLNRSLLGLAVSANGERVYVATDGNGVYRMDVR